MGSWVAIFGNSSSKQDGYVVLTVIFENKRGI